LGAIVQGISNEYPQKPSVYIETDLDDYIISEFGDLLDFNYLEEKVKSFEPDAIIHISEPYRISEQPDFVDFFRNKQLETFNLLEIFRKSGSVMFINLTPDFTHTSDLYCHNFNDSNIYSLLKNSTLFAESLVTSYRGSYFSASNNTSNQYVFNLRLAPMTGGGDWSMLNPFGFKEQFNDSTDNNSNVIHILDVLNGIIKALKKGFNLKLSYTNDFSLITDKLRTPDTYIKLSVWKPLIDRDSARQMCESWNNARNRGANMRTFTISQIKTFLANNEQGRSEK